MVKKPFDADRFKENLDACHQWPCVYVFKFIVASADLEQLVRTVHSMLDEPELSTRTTESGKWVSLTVEARIDNADQVLAVYERVATLEGILSL